MNRFFMPFQTFLFEADIYLKGNSPTKRVLGEPVKGIAGFPTRLWGCYSSPAVSYSQNLKRLFNELKGATFNGLQIPISGQF